MTTDYYVTCTHSHKMDYDHGAQLYVYKMVMMELWQRLCDGA